MSIKVVTDSVSDIPPEIASELEITVVPLFFTLALRPIETVLTLRLRSSTTS